MPLLLILLNAGVLVWFLAPPPAGVYKLRLDLDVYRLGAEMWLAGGDLYGRLPATIIGNHLPFTYPPISAVLFTPVTVVPYVVASFTLTALSIVGVGFVVTIVLRALGVRPTWALVGALLPLALWLEPVRVTLYFGQINVLLMVLVVADCLVRKPKWPRGLLVGLAAAIKLTPAAFVLFFLLRGDRRAAITAVASFLAATALGFLLNWSGSVKYWSSTVFNPDRIGKVTQESNQTINGFLARMGIERGMLWLVLVAVVLAVGVVAVRHAVDPVHALSLNALTVLLVSPVSWSHHWVWALPLLLAAGVTARRTRTPPAIVLVTGGLLVFLLSPHWWWDSDDGANPLSLTIGQAYLWCALGVLGWSAHRQFRRPRVDIDHRAVA